MSASGREEEIAAILERSERLLLDPAVRRDRERVLELLAEEFEEFGASGLAWTRDEIVELLAEEEFEPPMLKDFRCRLIAPSAALVTYQTERIDPWSGTPVAVNRSSIWIEEHGRWRVRFHQGTPAEQEGSEGG